MSCLNDSWFGDLKNYILKKAYELNITRKVRFLLNKSDFHTLVKGLNIVSLRECTRYVGEYEENQCRTILPIP